jgi:hypothetical protein
MRPACLLLVLVATAAAQEPLPTTTDVVAQMLERDNARQAALHGYTAARRYVLENPKHNKRAEMLVTVRVLENGSKQFQTVWASGWAIARNHVFPGLLKGESESSLPEVREQSRITSANYNFEITGRESIDQRPVYVLEIAPKTQNKYLVKGKIWVDAEEYAIVRIEGKPARNPSFWTKSVRFIHTYQKNGDAWLPALDYSVTDARIVGTTGLTIEYFDYVPDAHTLSAVRQIDVGSRP